jgi:hypothetical protein
VEPTCRITEVRCTRSDRAAVIPSVARNLLELWTPNLNEKQIPRAERHSPRNDGNRLSDSLNELLLHDTSRRWPFQGSLTRRPIPLGVAQGFVSPALRASIVQTQGTASQAVWGGAEALQGGAKAPLRHADQTIEMWAKCRSGWDLKV